MSRRTWIVSVSIAGHFAVGLGLYASGIWKLEKLESDNRLAGIGVMTPVMASGGSPAGLPEPKFERKEKKDKTVAKNVQWDKRVERDDKAAIAKSGETGNGEGEGKGDNKGDSTEVGPPGGATCAAPPCPTGSLPPLPDPPKVPDPPAPKPVPPHVMNALRTDGDTQIHPSRGVKNLILADGKTQVIGTVKVCIGTSGAISSATLMSSTKYPEYDRQLVDAVRSWRYRPYLVNGVPTSACSAVSFVYSIK